ncbi:cupin domain-containing protein [Pluralibacter gergoviae]|uniref:cupin domain-containing protein n=1 Tax=Pluralibacter gergoviae TaxID=61647 RepID=UPI0005EC533E|nr:cupin domain-containing protein [Pluralibacter gergoviae]KJM63506.1 cupin [Pluralibacter gergoviae]
MTSHSPDRRLFSAAADAAVEHFMLTAHDWVPNNARLPVLHYRQAIVRPDAGLDLASTMEQRFNRNGWPPQWRWGIYDFHHYHTEGHEVLGVFAGSAQVMLGGPGGRTVTLEKGDVVVLPTGTGHCCLSHSDDFTVVGAYPPGEHADINREAPDAAAQRRISTTPFPDSDPVTGAGGPLTALWRHAGR